MEKKRLIWFGSPERRFRWPGPVLTDGFGIAKRRCRGRRDRTSKSCPARDGQLLAVAEPVPVRTQDRTVFTAAGFDHSSPTSTPSVTSAGGLTTIMN